MNAEKRLLLYAFLRVTNAWSMIIGTGMRDVMPSFTRRTLSASPYHLSGVAKRRKRSPLSFKTDESFKHRSIVSKLVLRGYGAPYLPWKDSTYTLFSTRSDKERSSKDCSSVSCIEERLCSESEQKEPESVHKTLITSIQILKEYDAPEPVESACHLLSHALKNDFRWEDNGFATLIQIVSNNNPQAVSQMTYYNHHTNRSVDFSQKLLTMQELQDLSHMLHRRIRKEPLQYIIGKWDFYNCTLKIRSPCLCPRPETEELVDFVAQDIRDLLDHRHGKIRILDCGCGTGAIGIALAKQFPMQVEVVAIDVSPEAVSLSLENASLVLGEEKVKNNPDLYQAFVCSAFDYTNEKKEGKDTSRGDLTFYDFGFDIVVSNPPYIPLDDMSTLTHDVVEYEDYNALCGGVDGMDVIRDIIHRLPEWCQENGNSESKGDVQVSEGTTCWMEVDTSHPSLMEEWLKSHSAKYNVEFLEGRKDLSGLDRFVKLKVLST